jgi:hypothetical protein
MSFAANCLAKEMQVALIIAKMQGRGTQLHLERQCRAKSRRLLRVERWRPRYGSTAVERCCCAERRRGDVEAMARI